VRRALPFVLFGLLAATGVFVAINYDGDATAHSATPAPTPIARSQTPKAEAPPPPLARTLRTVSLGWEWIAPGVIASDGSNSAYKSAKLDVTFASATSMEDVESALAKGGGAGGADIAIVPLSSYVASYERLRALSPDVIFVVGWSRGREVLYAPNVDAIAKLPPSGPVKLGGDRGQPETFLALFLLDLSGVPGNRVELVPQMDRKAALTALPRSTKPHDKAKLLLTSADTSHAMPIVAVAPHGFIKAHASELETWGRVWLEGVERLQSDVPAGGRKVAALSGAPPVLSIIEGLGQIEFASLRDNATVMGLSGRGALTLDEAFRTTWRIWRDAGVLTTPPPEVTPLQTNLVASLVRAAPKAPAEAPRAKGSPDGKRPEVLLVVRAPAGKLDAEAFVNRLGFLAGVFDRLKLRVATTDPKTAQLFAEMARDRFGLRPDQLVVGKPPPWGVTAAVEVLSPN
jgi:hypothetical protein